MVFIFVFQILALDCLAKILASGFLCLDLWAWTPGLGFLGLDFWLWTPATDGVSPVRIPLAFGRLGRTPSRAIWFYKHSMRVTDGMLVKPVWFQ